MLLHLLPDRVRGFLERHTASPHYAMWVALVSLILTLVPSVPFGGVLVTAVLLDNRQWKRVWLYSSVAAAIGSLILLMVFHHWGWEQIVNHFPGIAQSEMHARVTQWVSRWGVWALFAVTIVPLPQTPALAVCAISDPPLAPAFIAILAGKGLRYGAYAWLAAKSPARARALTRRFGM